MHFAPAAAVLRLPVFVVVVVAVLAREQWA